MSCSNPSLAVDFGINPATGKHKIKIIRRNVSYISLKQKFGDMLLELPCGSCLDCKKTKAKEWAVRCYLESKSYFDNSFITLTYNEDCCPPVLVKKHLQLFLKRLRNQGYSFRYFASGEYGSETFRPHFHILFFGFIPNDLKEIGTTEKGSKIFSSEIISKAWPFGFSSIGMLEPASCLYVAQYNIKKLEVSDFPKKIRPFITMSRRPGLGFSWINEHLDEICDNLGVIYLGEFGIKNASRYILNIVKNYEPFTYDLIKNKKIKACKEKSFNNLFVSNSANLNEFDQKRYFEGLEAQKVVNRKY